MWLWDYVLSCLRVLKCTRINLLTIRLSIQEGFPPVFRNAKKTNLFFIILINKCLKEYQALISLIYIGGQPVFSALKFNQ